MEFYKLILILTLVSKSLGVGVVETVSLMEDNYYVEYISENIDEDIMQNIEIVDLHEGVDQIVDFEEMDNKAKADIVKFNENGMNLREGIFNEEVIRLKRFLNKKNYTGINEDYYFDNKTREAVIDYQKNKGLSPDGVVGRATYQVINRDMEENNINIPRRNLNFTNEIPNNYWILINKSSNTMYYLNGSNIIYRYPVATGRTPGDTPEGKFTIVTKVVNPAWGGAGRYTPVKGGAPNNPLGKRWMGLSVGGGGWYGIHGNADSSSIGKYISLGCIRMINEDVEFLYDKVELRTPVWIGNELKLNQFGVEFN